MPLFALQAGKYTWPAAKNNSIFVFGLCFLSTYSLKVHPVFFSATLIKMIYLLGQGPKITGQANGGRWHRPLWRAVWDLDWRFISITTSLLTILPSSQCVWMRSHHFTAAVFAFAVVVFLVFSFYLYFKVSFLNLLFSHLWRSKIFSNILIS